MNIVEAIVGAGFALIFCLMGSNVIAGLQAQSHGVASHQGGSP